LQGVNEAEPDGDEQHHLAVWARDAAFPKSGEGYGWADRKGKRHACASFEELSKTIREDSASAVNLVWTPDSPFCRVPEEIDALAEPIQQIRKRWATDDLADAQYRLRNFGIGAAFIVGYMAFQAWGVCGEREKASGLDLGLVEQLKFILKALAASTTVGLSLLAFLIFAFIPWYQSRKKMGEIKRLGGRVAPNVPLIRFETWLEAQKAPVTWALLGIITLVFLSQVVHDRSILGFRESVERAGLVKELYREGDYWRLFMAPMLHGGLIHFVMNALALLYLGKRLEVFARWPHVPMVFLFSALVGGEASARFLDAPSVGASGGLMGWLGFLLVFETLHSALVPRSAKRRLIGGVLMTALIGLVGYRFIDNAAHFGGLLAGMVYAAIVFPKSSSVMRPRMNATDRIVGIGSLAVIAASAIFAVSRMVG
jgi:membrane associated rhomboid family serine protease